MNTLHLGKRGLSLLLALVMLVTMLPLQALAEGSNDGTDGATGQDPNNPLNADTVYYEVSFALPKSISEEEAKEITLPETMLLPKGTLLYAVAEPTRPDYQFAGWYYDATLKQPADGGDTIERNLTLYPSFAPVQNLDDEFRINYMSARDVEPDYTIEIVAYGLTEEQARELLCVTDLSKVDGAEEFVLKRVAPDMAALIPDGRTRTLAMDAALKAQSGELEGTLIDALSALTVEMSSDDGGPSEPTPALDDAVIAELVAYYAPAEAEQTDAMQAADLIRRVKEAGFDPKNASLSQLISVMTEDELVRAGISADAIPEDADDTALDLEEYFADVLEALPAMHYTVQPAGGAWHRGDMHQVEILDTASLRFFRNGEAASKWVIYYNITVHEDDFNNMRLNSGVVFLPFADVEGVTLDNGLFKVDAENDGDEMTVVPNDDSGVLTYTGSETVAAGTTVAVYDGTLNADGTVDGEVGYFKITQVLGGGQYAYESPDFTDVVFLPDIIPIKDDGTFHDGVILLTSDQLNFTGELYETMGLGADTVVEPGDFLAIYTGSMDRADTMALVGYGCITAVEAEGSNLLVRYDAVSEQTMLSSADMFMHLDNVPVPMTDEEMEEVGRMIEQDIADSGFLEDSADYIKDLIYAPEEAFLPDSKYSDALKEIKFQREDGSDISLEAVRELAEGSKVEVDWPPKLSFLLGLTLQHFDGTGLRGEMAAEMTITIHLSDDGDIKITVVAMIEVEVALGLNIKWEVDWRKAWIFPYIYDIGGTVGLHAGIYVGAGITVTVKTVTAETDYDESPSFMFDAFESQNDTDYAQHSKMKAIGELGGQIQKLAKLGKAGGDGLHVSSIPGLKGGAKNKQGDQTKPDAEHDEMHNTVGGSFEEKYSNFIQGSDAKYVTLVNKPLAKFDLPADPLHIVALSLGINFVVKLKVNVMLGVSISYGNAKQITATFTIFHPHSESKCGDLETPNFQVDFFIFGMVGIRVGVEFDFRIGVISTALASLGVTAEIGVYLEFYGYFYIAYKWESGKGSHTEMFGSLLAQFGLYLDIDFMMQMGSGKLEQRFDIYDVRWPLLSLGSEFCALDFEIEDDDEKLNLEIVARTDKNKSEKSTDTKVIGGASIKVPDELFDIKFLEIDTGEIGSDNMDRNVAVGGTSSFTAMGVTYTQKDERNFHVEFTPKGKDFSNATAADKAKGAFLYDPVTNNIYAKPNSLNDTELWGEFTFTWYQGEPAKTKSALNFGAGFGLNTRKIERTVRVHWTGTPVKGTADTYLCNERGKGLSDDVSFTDAKKYYTKKDTLDFDGLEGVLYYMDLQGLTDRYPGYTLYAVKETYDSTALNAYYEMKINKGQIAGIFTLFRELARGLVYEEEYVEGDPSSKGWLLVDPVDTAVYCMMHPPKTEVDMYFDFSEAEADWHILDEEGNSDKPIASVYGVKYAPGYNALDAMPAAIQTETNRDPGYEYRWYMVSLNSMEPNIRDPKTNRVINPYTVEDGELEQYRLPDGLLSYVYIPAFSEVMGNRSKWIEVTPETKLPHAGTVFFALRIPKTFTVTWKYDDGDETTNVRYGEMPVAPREAKRNKFTFDHWEDKRGKQYTAMPAKDLTLYPEFIGKQYTVTWSLDGNTKTTTVTAGDTVLDHCPFKINNYAVNWTTTRGDILTTIAKDYEMPAKNLKLYGMYVYQCDWLLYDTGNGNYTELSSEYKYQTKQKGDTVLENLPEPIQEKLTDDRYTYAYFSTYTIGIDKVKENQGRWTTVSAKTQYLGRNTTYILQRSPIMVNVTWKYDDGDVVTSNWVGRKLVAPKEISRKGFTFIGWADADGKSYEYPPHEDVTLYPQFEEHAHSWDTGTVTTPATCVNEGEILYTCTDCGKTKIETIPVDPENHAGDTELRDAKAATCETEGYTGDTYCTGCGAILSHGEAIPALGHDYELTGWTWTGYTAATATFVCKNDASHVKTEAAEITTVRTEATCDVDGSVVYTATVSMDGRSYSDSKTEVLNKTGHDYGEPSYDWAGDGSRCTATAVCRSDASHVVTENAAIQSAVKTPATCEGKGVTLYTATFTNELFATQTKEIEDLPALGHDWGEPAYEWAADNSAVTATRICGNDPAHIETETVATVAEITKAATCEAKGETTYTATFTNTAFAKQSKTVVDIDALGHKSGEPVRENEKAATCTEAGSYNEVVYCVICGAELSREAKTIPALGHDWGEPAYEWVADNSAVTATRICGNDPAHIETETVATVAEITKAATCEAKGETTYTATFTNTAFAKQSKTVVDIDALGHKSGEPVRENEKAATCTEAGSYNEVVYCVICGAELSREAKTIPALGHDWGEPAYEWAADNNAVTATRICGNDPAHIETETAATVAEITKAATCEAKGETTYTATFANSAFAKQSKTVENIPALGHDYELTGWTWTGYTAATATFTCRNDTSHTQSVPAEITSERSDPTETQEGVIVYTATVTFESRTYTDSKTVSIPALTTPQLGSEFRTDDNKPAIEMAVLWGFASELLEEEQKTYLDELDPAEDLWLWAFVGESFDDENREDIEATLTWEEDYSALKLTEIREGDVLVIRITPADADRYAETIALLTVVHEHEPMEATEEDRVEPTCEEAGSYDEVVYCVICGAELSRETKTIPALGHDWGDWTVTTEPTCTEKGIETRVCGNDPMHTETREVPALGHDLVMHEAKAATCKEAGNSAYWHCERCGVYFGDAEGQNAIEENAWIIPVDPDAHVPGEPSRTEPYPILNEEGYCTEGWHVGSSAVVCTLCGAELSREVIKVKPTLINEDDTLTISMDNFEDASADATLAEYDWILSYWWPGVTSGGCMSFDRWDLEDAGVTWNAPNILIRDIRAGDTLSVHIRPSTQDLATYAETDVLLTVTEAPQPEPEIFTVIWKDGSANGTTLKTATFENGCLWRSVKTAMPAIAPREGQSYVWYYIMGNNGGTYPGSDDPSQVYTPQTEEELHYDDDTQLWIKGEIWDTAIIYTVWSPDEIVVGPSSAETPMEPLTVSEAPNETPEDEPEAQLTKGAADEPVIESASEHSEDPMTESDKEIDVQPVSGVSDSAPEALVWEVAAKIRNVGDIHEEDEIMFKAVITGDKSLVAICWQKLTENKITHQMEWITVQEGKTLRIQAKSDLAAEQYRVVLLDANGRECAEAKLTFPKILPKEPFLDAPAAEPSQESTADTAPGEIVDEAPPDAASAPTTDAASDVPAAAEPESAPVAEPSQESTADTTPGEIVDEAPPEVASDPTTDAASDVTAAAEPRPVSAVNASSDAGTVPVDNADLLHENTEKIESASADTTEDQDSGST